MIVLLFLYYSTTIANSIGYAITVHISLLYVAYTANEPRVVLCKFMLQLEEELRHATAQNKVIKEHHQNAEEGLCFHSMFLFHNI